ncbi:PilC/PilY family type IV pilus protein [Simplicispira suum]|uniref:Pilus assembly protein PilC n=1 Tax=Simplicispira suum TaxID=2109915 RepID=A0A2S0N1T7_9BURK|nr:PilC/PilY family type IV pilus protein [Simplicispira suum]AVO42112.1 pilus assembly protein PilC [Simplicispira suum]
MKESLSLQRNLLAALIAGIYACQPVFADPLDLSKLPPGLVAIPPAPNVILTVDDSGSMSESAGDGKSKIFRLSEALGTVFNDKLLLPDGKIRLAWQAMWNNGGSPGAGSLSAGATNSMKALDTAHRANFLAFASGLKANNGTPSHKMMKQAYDYMKTGKGIDSPWAYSPGTKEAPYLGCRRAYHIFLTDGAWNGYSASVLPGNGDNTDITLPDGVVYSTSSAQTNVYRGKSNNLQNLLADWAMRMWAEDLQPGISDDLKASTTDGVPSTETYGSVALQRYWNPKHDPASWQHVVHYTIGYGQSAYKWPSEPKWSAADDDNYGAGGDYSKLVQGTSDWAPTTFGNLNSNNPAELWHMAINSRGKFYPTGPGRKYGLKEAFQKIVEDINLQNTADVASMAGSASTNIRKDLKEYVAGYDPKRWSGYVKSNNVDTKGTVTPNTDWGTTGGGSPNTTANLLDAANINSRVILTTNTDVPNKGVSFEWDSGSATFSAAQKALLDVDGLGEDRVNFLRGDRTKEGGTLPFRVRDSRQGDIVNSNVWYVDAPPSNYFFTGYKAFSALHRDRLPMIYVGGNDGMLHGFSAKTGQEQIAYVPKAVIPELKKLSDPGYSHRYFVDGSPFTGDANVAAVGNPSDWRTLLVGTLGAGGKGYFILDVTQPGSKDGSVASTFTTGNAASLVVLDRTLHPSEPLTSPSDDEDIGHIFAAPVVDDNNPFKSSQVALMNDGRWAVVMGNGYNSKNERPVLLIQYLDDTNKVNGVRELKRIVATGSQVLSTPVNPTTDANVIANGLSAPRLVDIDSDGKVDIAYAGDLKGNLWKFDLTSATASNWGVAVWGSASTTPCTTAICTPLFTASYLGKRQAITAPPVVKPNDRGAGGMMVAFGTGVNLTDNDRSSTDVQSVYSVLDNTKYRLDSGHVVINTNTAPKTAANPTGGGAIPTAVVASNLVQQDLVGGAIAGQGKSSARTFWQMTQNSVNYVDTTKPLNKGWYFNFQVTGERVLKPINFFDASNNLMVFSTTPAYGGNGSTEESCEPAGTPEKQYLTLMNIMDGKRPSVQVMDTNGDGLYNSGPDKDASRMTLPPGAVSVVAGKDKITISGGDGKPDELARMPEQPMRPSWRQLQ